MNSDGIPQRPSASLASQAVRSVLARYALVAIGIAISVVLSRVLAADGRGAYSYVVAVASSVAWMSHASIETSLFLNWSSGENRRGLVGAALMIGVVVGAVAALVVGGWFVATEPQLPQGAESWMLVAAVSTTPVALVVLYANAALANDGRIESINIAALLAVSVQLVLVVGLVMLGLLTVASAVILWVVGVVVSAAFLIPRLVDSPGLAWPDRRIVLRLLKDGLKYHLGAVALALILRVDVILLGSRVTVNQLGIYSLAVVLVELGMIAASASSQVALQVQVGGGDPRAHGEFAAGVARANALVAGVFLVLLGAVGPWAIVVVFGDSYDGTIGPILVLAPGILALAIMRPLIVFITRLDRPFMVSAGLVSGLIVNVGLNLAMIPRWGIIGAAFASSVVYTGLLIWIALWFKSESNVMLRSLVPTRREWDNGWAAITDPNGWMR